MKKATDGREARSKSNTKSQFPKHLSFFSLPGRKFAFSRALDSSFSLKPSENNPDIGLQYSADTKRPKWRCALQSTLNCLPPDPKRPREVRKTAVEDLIRDLAQNDSIALKESDLVKLRLDESKTVFTTERPMP